MKRLGPEDVAIIDHRDLDRMAAEDLVECGVRGVVNVAPSTSTPYPNPGPLILVRAGVQLGRRGRRAAVRGPGRRRHGDLREGTVLGPKGVVAEGTVRTLEELTAVQEHQQERIGEAIQDFAENTLMHIRDEREVLAGRLKIPDLRTDFRDRHALIVVRGTDYRRDLRAIRPYVRDLRPVLVGVDGGGDALLEAGLKPDLIIGDMDSASDKVLAVRRGAGRARVPRTARRPAASGWSGSASTTRCCPRPAPARTSRCCSPTSGARLIVSVGSHFNLIEFLDKDRAGMSSTFLTRLRVGEILVDTKGVSRLYPAGPSRRLMLLILLAAFVTFVIVVLSSPPMERLIELIWLKLQVLFDGA